MAKEKRMSSCPLDRPVLLKIEGHWIEGQFNPEGEDDNSWNSRWSVISLPSHGCGCCMTANEKPTAWQELPHG